MKRRILVLLAVVALMVVMLAMSVAPAFAARPVYVCTIVTPEITLTIGTVKHQQARDLEAAGYTCVKEK
jgi:hypothetical protein